MRRIEAFYAPLRNVRNGSKAGVKAVAGWTSAFRQPSKDRFWRIWGLEAGQADGRVRCARLMGWKLQIADHADRAVSYTHLRAHET